MTPFCCSSHVECHEGSDGHEECVEILEELFPGVSESFIERMGDTMGLGINCRELDSSAGRFAVQ
jgi:hypothetical protein